ncbi:hypothetical protein XELAEV_18034675mg [Xenopus laevis]|uniref:Uncharacterized protein n=1 Tax=Xenopus laevis TaxID=8355 RepID=A0A974CGI9_XENLA|nr:hypothetical protein XELAEV_18034675mg [Xenopus laevis]
MVTIQQGKWEITLLHPLPPIYKRHFVFLIIQLRPELHTASTERKMYKHIVIQTKARNRWWEEGREKYTSLHLIKKLTTKNRSSLPLVGGGVTKEFGKVFFLV